MLLTIFLAIVFSVAITLMMLSAVAFIQDKKFFTSAPKEAQEALISRENELFYGARTIGWTLMIFSMLMILGVGVISIRDGFRSGFSFSQFFLRFAYDNKQVLKGVSFIAKEGEVTALVGPSGSGRSQKN